MGDDEVAAVLAHFLCGGGIAEDGGKGLGDRGGIERGDDAGVGFFDLGKMAFGGDDDRDVASHGFGDGEAESFLAAGETETIAIAECGEFLGGIERADEVNARGDAETGDLGFESGLSAVVGAGDDQVGIGEFFGDDGECVGEIVQSFFVVQAAEEED